MVRELVDNLNDSSRSLEPPYEGRLEACGLDTQTVGAFWTAWSSATRYLRRARNRPGIARALGPLAEKVLCPAFARGVPLTIDPDGFIRYVEGPSLRAAALLPAFQLLEQAQRTGRYWAVFSRLRRCDQCRRFFDDERRRRATHARAFCSPACQRAGERTRETTPRARAQATARVVRHRAKMHGLDAKPGLCRDPIIATPAGFERRVVCLLRQGLTRLKAEDITQGEVNRLDRWHRM